MPIAGKCSRCSTTTTPNGITGSRSFVTFDKLFQDNPGFLGPMKVGGLRTSSGCVVFVLFGHFGNDFPTFPLIPLRE
jgi:hypothetical protein